MSDYMDARNIGYWLQRIYHDLAGSTMVYMDARKDEYWLQQIYKELTGIDLVGDQRSFDWWSEAIYRHIIGDSSTVRGTVPANVSWQLIYASRASAAYPDGSSALSVEFWIQQAQRVGLEDSTPIVTPWYRLAGYAPIAAWQPKGAVSQAASYENVDNPGTHDAVPVVAPTWNTLTGWTHDGVTQYLSTDIVPASGYTMIVRIGGSLGTGNQAPMGADGPADSRLALCNSLDILGLNLSVYCSGGFVGVSPAMAAGILCVAGQQGYRNGVAEGAAISAWTAPNTFTLTLGCWNMSGVPSFFFFGNWLMGAIYSNTFTAGEVLVTANAMAAL